MGCRPRKRTAVTVFLCCLCHVFLTSLVLNAFYIPYYQTGSFMPPDDYEWYNSENFAVRRFPNDSPVNWSGLCSAKDKRALPSVEDVGQEIQELLGPKKEHLVRSDELCALNATQRIAVVHNPSSRRGLLAFLWNSILPPETSPCPCSGEPKKEEEDENKQSSFGTCLYLQAYDISLHLLSWPVNEEDLSSYDSVIVVGDLSPQVREILNAMMKEKDIKLGLITVGNEDCQGPKTLADIHPALQFMFITYGSCGIVDNERAFLWPLGTAGEEGNFPTQLKARYNPSMADRTILMNLMVTFTIRKPSRRQALMIAEKECSALSKAADAESTGLLRNEVQCVLQQMDSSHPSTHTILGMLISFFTPLFSPNYQPSLTSAISSYLNNFRFSASLAKRSYQTPYVKTLRSSVLTLCPAGSNPESFRIWEAILTDSIPVVENYTLDGGLHPAYGSRFGCLQEDINTWLKITQAPVYWVKDWKEDLPAILRDIWHSNSTTLQTKQNHMRSWKKSLFDYLRLLLVRSMLKYLS